MFQSAGLLVIRALAAVGEVSIFGLLALREAFRRPFEFRELVRHLYEVGWRSAPLIAASVSALTQA